MFLEFFARLSLGMIVFEGLKVVLASAATRALINNNTVGCRDQQLLAGVAFFLAGIVAFAFLFIFRFAFGLLDAINDKGEFRISFFEFFK